eukprot:Hpha_TRINITY_DN220_c0_g1::TRINITY_DN220_c0_g1_i1::g.83712::m.83712
MAIVTVVAAAAAFSAAEVQLGTCSPGDAAQRWTVAGTALYPATTGHCLSADLVTGSPLGVVKCGSAPERWNYTMDSIRTEQGFCLIAGDKFSDPDLTAESRLTVLRCMENLPVSMEFLYEGQAIKPRSAPTLCLTVVGTVESGGGGGGLTGGGVFLIVFFVGMAMYFAAGAGFLYHKGERGVDLVPQKDFWADLPILCKDGAVFVVRKIRGAGGHAYSSVV